MEIKTLVFILSLLVLVLVLELSRRDVLTFKYMLAWGFVSVCGIFFSFFDEYLFKAASFFGFQLPSNFIFFALLCAFIFLSLLLTIFLCQQNNRNDIIAQKVGLLEMEIQKLRKQLEEKS